MIDVDEDHECCELCGGGCTDPCWKPKGHQSKHYCGGC